MLNASANVSFSRMLYVTNHDQNFNESKKTLTQKYGNNRYPLTVLAYTLYGMPLIYNGQEVGGNQALDYFNDTKINWSSPDTKMLNTIRTLTALKHAVPALGDKVAVNWVTLSSGAANVLAFTRKQGDSEVLVVLNLATTATNATLTGLTAGSWSQWLTSETISQGSSRRQQQFSATQALTLEAKGYRVYVRGTFPEEDIPTTGIKPLSIDGSALSAQSSQFYDLSGLMVQRSALKVPSSTTSLVALSAPLLALGSTFVVVKRSWYLLLISNRAGAQNY